MGCVKAAPDAGVVYITDAVIVVGDQTARSVEGDVTAGGAESATEDAMNIEAIGD